MGRKRNAMKEDGLEGIWRWGMWVRVWVFVMVVGMGVPGVCRGQAWRNPSPGVVPAWANPQVARSGGGGDTREVMVPAREERMRVEEVPERWGGSVPGGGGIPASEIVRAADAYAKKGIRYVFGSTDPRRGLDCSATVQMVLSAVGVRDVPRNSQAQYDWLARAGTLGRQRSEARILSSLRPGQLLFWGGTYGTRNRVSHVMIYLGRDPRTGRRYMFGGRSSGTEGFNGSNVDVYAIDGLRGSGRFVGYGSVPGVVY